AVTPSRHVSAGFFRVHLWVTLGLSTFAATLVFLLPGEFPGGRAIGIGAAIAATLSYVGAVVWLYEKARAGVVFLWLVALVNLFFGWRLDVAMQTVPSAETLHQLVPLIDFVSSGMVIGLTFAAMLLGHWYLNTPTMKLDPLKRLLIGMAIVTLLRIAVCGFGVATLLQSPDEVAYFSKAVLSLRWLAGLGGLLGLTYMTWETLKIPNTQSATGILYVGVIFVFIGELASRLLSVQHPFPL
ncbi:MAG: hypothetical protein KDB27_26445, partial [Planctomycetales bacterium]|nr:hypothetical protein [Planctomycetales bacterium]